jgi:plastocyanin
MCPLIAARFALRDHDFDNSYRDKDEGDTKMRRGSFIGRAVLLVAIGCIKAVSGGEASLAQSQPAAAASPQAKTAEVKIDNFKFGPEALTVPVGATVTWTNRDDIPHTVVSTEGWFKSKVMDTDEKFTFTFAKAGTYDYFCSIHPKMVGKVIVQ